jgi:dihydroorotase
MNQITITTPDDWHIHVRSGQLLKTVISHTAKRFKRAIIMPNLNPPVTTVSQALQYRDEILHALPKTSDFNPLMTLYLTDTTSVKDIHEAAESEHVHGFKLYPSGATTNSQSGISQLEKTYPLLETMQELAIPLLIHGEVTDSDIDIFDREKVFIERHLTTIIQKFPALRIVLEHITTKEAVHFIQTQPQHVAATITPQHLMFNRNAFLVGGIKPHHYCLPIIKREIHRQALIAAATSGSPKFFLGTDSAPHLKHHKESSCGCAGCFSAHAAIEFYAEIFERAGALSKLEGFASHYGADFYQLPRNTSTLSLVKENWDIPTAYPSDEHEIIPLNAGQHCTWKII